jgi:hypothetical protein
MDVLDTNAPLKPVDAATMRAMSLRDYNMRDTDEPCRTCGHNVNAVKDAANAVISFGAKRSRLHPLVGAFRVRPEGEKKVENSC